jgi:toxin FitB
MPWLIDTNVLSELRRPKPEPKVVTFFETHHLRSLYLSAVTLAEIRFGIASLAAADRRTEFEEWLTRIVRPTFEGRILPVSEDVILRWRQMMESGRKDGHTFGQPDLFIAATADLHGLTVVSRDLRQFERAGVSVYNPWAD